MSSAVRLRSVSVAFGDARVVDDVSLDVEAGAWVTLIGPNGAGKTTVLRAVAGLVPFEGEIRLHGAPVAALGRRRLARGVAYVPQRPLIPDAMTVVDYVLLGRTPYIPYLRTEGRHDVEVVHGLLDRLSLSSLAGREVGSLSGGELQRAVLARALAQEGWLLLLDEPTSALDVGHQQAVLELVDELRTERGLTVIAAMHDLTLAAQFAQRLILLDRGLAVAEGPVRTVLTERTIRDHYGAVVRIIEDRDGGILVVPVRAAPRAAAPSEAVLP